MDASSGSDERATTLLRRRFIGVAVGASATVALSTSSNRMMTADQSAMVLQVAQVGAVFPIDFPSFGEPGPAWARATPRRLRSAMCGASRPRAQQAVRGARALIGHGLLGKPPPRLLAGIGELGGRTGPGPGDLTAVVAIAIATVSWHFDPDASDAAELWIEILCELRQRGWPT
jgi:hypothetical protein